MSYEKPYMDICTFDTSDVLTISNNYDDALNKAKNNAGGNGVVIGVFFDD